MSGKITDVLWRSVFQFDDVTFQTERFPKPGVETERATWKASYNQGPSWLIRRRDKQDSGNWGPWVLGLRALSGWTIEIPRPALLILTDMTFGEIRNALYVLAVEEEPVQLRWQRRMTYDVSE
jgi:hypothetical protein